MSKKVFFICAMIIALVSQMSLDTGLMTSAANDSSLSACNPDAVQSELLDNGIAHTQIFRNCSPDGNTTGPWSINMLELDPARARVSVGRALDEALGVEPVSSIAVRKKAIAAVNAGYFRTQGLYRGEPDGLLKVEGKVISEPHPGRTTIGFISTDSGQKMIFGHLRFYGFLEVKGTSNRLMLDGINRPRYDNDLVIYTPEFHRTTLTGPDGVEIVVKNDRVIDVIENNGSTVIPDNGYVISGSGDQKKALLYYFSRGKQVRVFTNLISDNGDQNDWEQAQMMISAGPSIVQDGKIDIRFNEEDIPASLSNNRYARTALALLKNGHFLLVTVDSSQAGMTLSELAQFLIEKEAVYAVNLDGGSSTSMYIQPEVSTIPLNISSERAVGEAILLYP